MRFSGGEALDPSSITANRGLELSASWSSERILNGVRLFQKDFQTTWVGTLLDLLLSTACLIVGPDRFNDRSQGQGTGRFAPVQDIRATTRHSWYVL